MDPAELFSANVNQIHATKICSIFSNTHGCHLEMEIFIFPCSQYQPYASKQAIFFRMSQGRRINVLKLGMKNPSDHDLPFLK